MVTHQNNACLWKTKDTAQKLMKSEQRICGVWTSQYCNNQLQVIIHITENVYIFCGEI